MRSDREKILDKIRKCLRLWASSNEHEAAAALRQAQALMAQLGMSRDDVAAAEASSATAKSAATTRPVAWEVMLANLCKVSFGCDVIFEAGDWIDYRRRGAGSYRFVGCESRAELCAYAFVVLVRQARRARADYIAARLKRCRRPTQVARADEYCRGWVVAVGSMVEAFARTDEDRQAVAAWISTMGIATQTSEVATRKVRKANGDAYAGLLAGREVKLDRPVGGREREAIR